MPAAEKTPTDMKKVAFASFVGALLEWFDFYAFATAAALVLGPLYFPSHDKTLSAMASFGALASGFLARPLGGLLFGHMGDRWGRKTSLVATLLIIGIGTFGIGILPSYNQIGMAAPILLVLLRVLQGIGLGGEYGGASLMTIEHAPLGKRGFWGSLPQAASPGGLLLSSLVFSLCSMLPQAQFLAWGWRIPFLLSLVLLLLGLFIRLRVSETPEFEEAARSAAADEAAPSLELLRDYKRITILALVARMAETVSGNMVKTFGLSYATNYLNLSSSLALHALSATALVGLVATPIYGALSDRFGRRGLYMVGCAAAAILAFPFFALLEARTGFAVWAAFILAYNLGPTLMLSVQPTFFSEIFHTRVRYTALSVAYQVSSIIGGFTPVISVKLLSLLHNRPWGVAGMLVAVALLSFVASFMAPRDGAKADRRLLRS